MTTPWSRSVIAGMIDGDTHQGYIHAGCAHVLTMPYITIDGDTAVATCYGQLFRNDGENFRIWRVTATRWELRREADGWVAVVEATMVLLGWTEANRGRAADAIRQALEEFPPESEG